MPPELTEAQWDQIDREIYAGRTIEAIKLYRGHTDLGLKDSKDAIDQRRAHLEQTNPKLFLKKGGGCMPVLLLLVIPLIGVIVWSLNRAG